MSWVDKLRERNLRLIAAVLVFGVFIKSNWGSTLDAISHLYIVWRTRKTPKLNTELTEELGRGIIAQGDTCATLLLCAFIWCVFYCLIKLLDVDSHRIENDNTLLIKENKILLSLIHI